MPIAERAVWQSACLVDSRHQCDIAVTTLQHCWRRWCSTITIDETSLRTGSLERERLKAEEKRVESGLFSFRASTSCTHSVVMYVTGLPYQGPAEQHFLSRSACSFEPPWVLSHAKQDCGPPHRCKTRQSSRVTFSGYVSTMDPSSTVWHSVIPPKSSPPSEAADRHLSRQSPNKMLNPKGNNFLQDLCQPSATTNVMEMPSCPNLAPKQRQSQVSFGSPSMYSAHGWQNLNTSVRNTERPGAKSKAQSDATTMTDAGHQGPQLVGRTSRTRWDMHGEPERHRHMDRTMLVPIQQKYSTAQCQQLDNTRPDSADVIDGSIHSHYQLPSSAAFEATMPFHPQLLPRYDNSHLYPLSPPIQWNDAIQHSAHVTGSAANDYEWNNNHVEQSPSILTPAPSQHDSSWTIEDWQTLLPVYGERPYQSATQTDLGSLATMDQMLPTAGLDFEDEFSAPFDLSGLLDQQYKPTKDASVIGKADQCLSKGIVIKLDTTAQDGADLFRSSPGALRTEPPNRSNLQRDLDPFLVDAEGTSLRDFVVQSRNNGVPYRRITAELLEKYQIDIAESTVRGKHRTWTIPKEQRARKPEWPDQAVSALPSGKVDFDADCHEDPMLI